MKLEMLNMILTIFNILWMAVYPLYFRLMCSIMSNQLSEHESFTQNHKTPSPLPSESTSPAKEPFPEDSKDVV